MKRPTLGRLAAWFATLSLLVVSVTLVGSAPAAQSQSLDDSVQRPTRVVKNPRLDSRLAKVAATAVAAPAQALATAKRSGLDTANSRVRVVVESAGAGAQAAIVAVGGTVESAVEGLVEALVPPAGLDALLAR